jgi:GR25 family glycosyltransferase involved in LPS biosynthesis
MKSIFNLLEELINSDSDSEFNFYQSNTYAFYIVHYDKLVDRKDNLLEQFRANHINNFTFITDYRRDNLLTEDLQLFDQNSLSLGSIAITLSHLLCYYRLIMSQDAFCVIIEDDVIFDHHFKNKLDHYIHQLPDDWDMCFLGDGCGFHIPADRIRNSTNIYLKENDPVYVEGRIVCHGSTRCVDSYLISRKCAYTILSNLLTIEQIHENIDHWLNDIIRKFDFKVYWAEPTIVTQGSQSGKFQTWSWI